MSDLRSRFCGSISGGWRRTEGRTTDKREETELFPAICGSAVDDGGRTDDHVSAIGVSGVFIATRRTIGGEVGEICDG